MDLVEQKLLSDNELIELKLRALDATDMGIVISRLKPDEKEVIYVNSVFEEITGFDSSDVLGKGCCLLFSSDEEGQRDLLKGLDTAMKQGERGQAVLKCLRKDGSSFWNELTISPILDKTGEVKYFVCIVKDVTDAVEAQQVLSLRRTELELSTKRLEQFVDAVSHDLKEPLRMVRLFISYLSSEYQNKLGRQAQKYIQYVQEGADRMHDMIEGLLEYSRLGARYYENQQVDLNLALQIALENLQMTIAESGAEISYQKLPLIQGVQAQFVTLFQNLISNAIKYSGNKIPQIMVTCDESVDSFILSVRDNGIGIDEYYSSYIFEIFNRLHSRKDYDGSGIGLALCKKIVELHGGSIWFESELGEGTCFFIKLTK